MANPMLDFLSGNDSSPDLMNKESQESSWRWATVTAASPLAIRLDNSPSALSATPIDLVGGLKVGDRVWAQLVSRRVIVHGKGGGGGGGSIPPPRAPLNSYLTWGTVANEFTIQRDGYKREIRGAINGSLNGGTTTISTAIPVGDRPTLNQFNYMYVGGGFPGAILVRPNGLIALINQSGATRSGDHQFSIFYTLG